ncbi:MAG: GlcNAc-transferase family protein [Gammaproteobacteria bacterium]
MTNDHIFVQIPAYRDRECQWTLKSLFEKAARPERVFVGICWQTIPEQDADCFQIPCPRPEQTREVHFHAHEAKGLGWARAQCQALWQGEAWTLQIDSHMRFVDAWDDKMLAQLAACDSPRAVLTVYPPGYEPPDTLNHWSRPYVQTAKRLYSNGVLEFSTRFLPDDYDTDKPKATSALAGGFIFGPGSIIEDVPSDPEIYFNGEEPNLAIRLWTHGYDLYSPVIPVIYHYYGRHDSRRIWDDFKDNSQQIATTVRRMRQLCAPDTVEPGKAVDLGRYGLGNARSLADYERFSGVRFADGTIAAYARHHPFVYDPEAIERNLREHPPRLSPSAHLLVIDDQGFAFAETTGELLHLNPAAIWYWSALEDGVDFAGLIARRVNDGVEPASAHKQTLDLISHWQGHGLLAGFEDTALVARDLETEPKPKSLSGLDRIEPEQWITREWQVLGRGYHLDCADETLARCVDQLFPDSSPTGVEITHRWHVQWTPRGRWVLLDLEADRMLAEGRQAAALIAALHSRTLVTEISPPAPMATIPPMAPMAPIARFDAVLLSRDGDEDGDGEGLLIVQCGYPDLARLLPPLFAAGYRWAGANSIACDPRDFACLATGQGVLLRQAHVDANPEGFTDQGWTLHTDLQVSHIPKPLTLAQPPARFVSNQRKVPLRRVLFIDPDSERPCAPLPIGESIAQLFSGPISIDEPLTLDEAVRWLTWLEQLDYAVTRPEAIEQWLDGK